MLYSTMEIKVSVSPDTEMEYVVRRPALDAAMQYMQYVGKITEELISPSRILQKLTEIKLCDYRGACGFSKWPQI